MFTAYEKKFGKQLASGKDFYTVFYTACEKAETNEIEMEFDGLPIDISATFESGKFVFDLPF